MRNLIILMVAVMSVSCSKDKLNDITGTWHATKSKDIHGAYQPLPTDIDRYYIFSDNKQFKYGKLNSPSFYGFYDIAGDSIMFNGNRVKSYIKRDGNSLYVGNEIYQKN